MPLSHLPLLTEAEILALGRWNATQSPFLDIPVHYLFERQVEKTPQAVAVTFNGETLSYRELNDRANLLAARLRAMGLGPDVCAGICLERSPQMIVAVLAILKAGGAYVPLDPNYPSERLSFMIENSRVRVIITQEGLAPGLARSEARMVTFDGHGDERMAVEYDSSLPGVTPDHLAYVIYTSGSTGHPKGVAMPHGALANLLHWQIARSDLREGSRTLQFASLSFDVSFQEIFSTLGVGGTLVLINEEDKRNPHATWQLLRTMQVARLFLPYVALQQLADCARGVPELPDSLKEIVTAGEQLLITPSIVELFERLGCALYNQYGPSETHVATELRLSATPSQWPARPAIGGPIANVAVQILDEDRRLVSIGVPGEIYIGGTGLARGYIHRPDVTAERFVSDAGGRRLYRTGDRARYLEDGSIEFLGRLDEQLKIRGFRVEPQEIEIALRKHKAVCEAAVAAWKLDSGDVRLVAYVQFDAGTHPSWQELRSHLGQFLPSYMIPATFVLLDKLPLTPSGKLNRRALPKPADADARSNSSGSAPRTPTEKWLARLWCELLGLTQVGIQDDFFELGGHSLLAVRVMSRLRDEFHLDIPLRDIFDASTIAELAAVVLQHWIQQEDREWLEQILAKLEPVSDEEAVVLLS